MVTAKEKPMSLPFDGAISKFYKNDAPKALRKIIEAAGKDGVTDPDFPYPEELPRAAYDAEMERLQIELVRFQAWSRPAVRAWPSCSKGATRPARVAPISAMVENLNPRGARIVALAKPTETEAGEWYFQRYVRQLPSRGEIVLFDRSGIIGALSSMSSAGSRPRRAGRWFDQVCPFETMLRQDGIHLVKIWLNVHRATQLERFLDREKDPLKQWKLSQIDIDGLHKWDAYSQAIIETLGRTHTETNPWKVIRGDDKRRARRECHPPASVPAGL